MMVADLAISDLAVVDQLQVSNEMTGSVQLCTQESISYFE